MVMCFHCNSGWLGAAMYLRYHPQQSSNLVLFSPEKTAQLLLRIMSLRCVTFGFLVCTLLLIFITFPSSFGLRMVHILSITSLIPVSTLDLGLEF